MTVAKPCSCCFPTHLLSCYCNYQTSLSKLLTVISVYLKTKILQPHAASPSLHLSFSNTPAAMETWDETEVNRIRAEKKLKAGNWSSSAIDFKDENLSLKLLIDRLKPVAARWDDLESSWEWTPIDSVSFSATHTMWNVTWVICSCTGLLTMNLLQVAWHDEEPTGSTIGEKNTKVRAYT